MFMYFLLNLVRQGSFFNPIQKKNSGTIVVLANGPSLKEVLPHLTVDSTFKNVDFIVMNFFAFNDVFFKIKPKYYCLADPTFIQDSFRKEDVIKLYKIFKEKIDWDINIYVPGQFYCKRLQEYSKLTNKFIHFISLNAMECFVPDGLWGV